jgi:DUF1009 family protein
VIGLVAGDGHFPLEIARAARRRGDRVAAVAFSGITDARLAEDVEEVCWKQLGELQGALDFLHGAGVTEAVLAGKVSKTHLLLGLEQLKPDARALALLADLPDLNDDSLLRALADTLEGDGITLLHQAALVPELFVGEGIQGQVHPTRAQWSDIAYGWPIARQLGGLDIGQTVVVHERAVLAVEAIEGTDAAIRRAGKLGRPGLCIVKTAKPDQDPRFDLPAIGLETMEAAAEAGAGVVAFEASQTVVLDRAEVIRRADACGIALVAVGEAGPTGA